MPAPTIVTPATLPRRSARAIFRLVAFASVAAAIAACGDSGTGPGDGSVGLYKLATYNGAPLPFTQTSVDTFYDFIYNSRVTLLSGSIALNSNHTFEEKARIHVVFSSNDPNEPAQDTTMEDGAAGTYTIDGTKLRLLSLPDTLLDGRIHVDTTRATIADNTITLSDSSSDGVTTIVFKK